MPSLPEKIVNKYSPYKEKNEKTDHSFIRSYWQHFFFCTNLETKNARQQIRLDRKIYIYMSDASGSDDGQTRQLSEMRDETGRKDFNATGENVKTINFLLWFKRSLRYLFVTDISCCW